MGSLIAAGSAGQGAIGPRELVGAAFDLLVGTPPDMVRGQPPGVMLDVARVMIPVLAAATLLAFAWGAVRNRVLLWIIAWRGEHLVITAAGEIARDLAEGEIGAGRPVVLWRQGEAPDWLGDLTHQRAPITDDLARTGLSRARALVLTGTAAEQAGAARRLAEHGPVPRGHGDALEVLRVSAEPATVDEADDALPDAIRTRTITLAQLAGRSLFLQAPFVRFVPSGTAAPVLLAFGLGPAAEDFIARILIGFHPRRGERPRIIVLTPDPAACEAAFRRRRHAIDQLAPVTFRLSPPDLRALAALLDELGERIAGCLIGPTDEDAAVNLAQAIDRHFREQDRPCPPLCLEAQPDQDGLPPSALPFGIATLLRGGQGLLQDSRDGLAQSLHQFYLEGRLNEGEALGARASLHEWEDLAESFREDNRLAADCYQLKLRDVGARITPGRGQPLRLTATEIEDLARTEHDRWMVSKLGSGWRYGAQRDDARRVHPDIVPYDALSERVKDLDREQVRVITRLLAASGRRALRVIPVALTSGGADPAPPLLPLLAALARHYPDRLPLIGVSTDDPAAVAAVADLAPEVAGVMLVARRYHTGPAARLLRRADTVVALRPDEDPRSWLTGWAQLSVTAGMVASEGDGGGAADVRLASDGTIQQAPWQT